MAFQVSPGIDIREIDLSTTVPSVGVNTGAIAGVFRWGPTDERIRVRNEIELVSTFGKPKRNFNQETFFTAADYLAYTDSLYVVRVSDGNTAVASANTDISARYPGELGNSISVLYADGGEFDTLVGGVKDFSRNAPSSNTNVTVVVLDTDGSFTGTANTVLEIWEDVGTEEGDKTYDGRNNYLIDVINENSNYITVSESANLEILTTAGAATLTFTGGTDGSNEGTITYGTLTDGYDLFDNPEEVEIGIMMQGKALGTNDYDLANYLISICDARKDCLAFISPAREDVVSNAGDEATDVIAFADGLTSSSYAVMDSGYKYRYDKYNDMYTWVPLNGDIAGITARTDDTRDPWFSPAGYNRGLIKNVIKLAWNPKQIDRDDLYQARVNPVITQPGTGTLLFGDKTLLDLDSAFNRINVRRLFITIEKAIARYAKSLMFEFNDEFTRAQFTNAVEPYLRDVQGRRGIYDFRVVCDETNNTAELIDRNEFRGDIYVKPARSINFIQLNFVAVRTGVEFEEVVGRF